MADNVRLAISLTRAVSEPLLRQLNPIHVAESARANKAGIEYGTRVLTRCRNFSSAKAKEILDALVQSYPAHNFVVDVEELERLGVPAAYPLRDAVAIVKCLFDVLYSLREDKVELFPKANNPAAQAAPAAQAKQTQSPSKRSKRPR